MRLRPLVLTLALVAGCAMTPAGDRAAPAATSAAGPEVERRPAAPPPRRARRANGKTQAPDLAPLSAFDLKSLTISHFTYDWPDGAGGDISYGGGALGVSEDGNVLYISCNSDDRGFAKLAIPGDGEQAPVVAPCLGPNRRMLAAIHPDPNASRPMLGGILEQDGRLVVAAYISYDANGNTRASHWAGRSLDRLAGPFNGTVAPGLVKSQMGPIPAEWREALGGPAFSTAGYTSIISRASYGAAFSVFDPKDVTGNDFPMTMLLGCPHEVEHCRTWTAWGRSSDGFEGSELSGGAFIVPGTRTLVVVEREGAGTPPAGGTVGHDCYGYTTSDRSLHGRPYPSPEGVRYCYSLADPQNVKGNKAYPYRLVAKLYDLADLVEVRNGGRAPWDVTQYATVDLPGSSPSEHISSGAYNPVRNEFYLLRHVGGGVNTVHVYRGFPARPAP